MTELAVIDNAPALDIGAWGDALVFAGRMSQAVSDTEFVPAVLKGRPEAVTALIMYGLEIGVTPMQALNGMHIVDGRPAPSAELMRALIYRAGHVITVHESSATRCRVSGLRKGRPEAERYYVEWTLDQARAAGLLGRRNWQSYPRAMLVARATGDLARALFPDVIKGLGYIAEDDTTADAGWVTEPEPEPAPVRPALQRKRKAPAKPAEDVALPPMSEEEAQQAERYSRTIPARWLTDEEAVAYEQEQAARAREALQDAATEPEPEPVAPPVKRKPGRPRKAAPTRVDTEDRPLPLADEPPAGAPPILPAPEPERPAPEPPPPPDIGRGSLLGAAPMRALQAGLTRELGTVATPAERHALLTAILGREVTTSKDLTRAEGLRALDMLGQFESGAAAFDLDLTAPENEPRFIITEGRPEPAE